MNTPHVLIIGFNWPEPKSSAAGSRMMQLIALFKSYQWTISFASAAKKTGFNEDLETQGVACYSIAPNTSTADELLLKMQPDVVVFDRFMMEEQFGWKVAEHCPKALRILDTEDLHFLRKARQEAVKGNRKVTEEDLFNDFAKREIAAILRCDLSLIISKMEYQLLQTSFSIADRQLVYLPFLLPSLAIEEWRMLPSYTTRKHFMFVGNFLHPPNYDAVLFLKTKIWPEIHRQLPEAELHIYGAYTSQKVQQLDNKIQKFRVLGRCDQLFETMQHYRVLLAPLRFGAGLKGKFFDAMRNALPSITTSIGIEGISTPEDFPGKVADTPAFVIKAAVELYNNAELWEAAIARTIPLIQKNFLKENYEESFKIRLQEELDNLERNRKQNFYGQMLLHHRLQSTKYMSRWIESKNKLN